MQTWTEYIRDHDFECVEDCVNDLYDEVESDADRTGFIAACVDIFQVTYPCVVNAIGAKLNADSSYHAERAMERRIGA